jgi:hypothetical protein
MTQMTRRTAMKTAVGGSFVLATASCSKTDSPATKAAPKPLKKDAFYKEGAFQKKASLQAYYDMMNYFNYPIPDILKTDTFWTCDFVQNDFLKLGMGGVFWINESGVYGKAGAGQYKGDYAEKNYGYLGHEIYLLPGQALPEHSHTGGVGGYGPKMEAWQVRYGDVEFFGQYKGADGEETLISDMPESERPWGYGEDWFKSKYVAKRTSKSGKVYAMRDAESWHFQRAGKNGAIVCEYATYHNHVMFSKPGMEFACTGDKPAAKA